jgi:hypothetical protein
MSIRSLLKLRWINAIAITAALGVFPALAQNANFGSITISSNSLASTPSLRGYTDGSFSLSSIANRDRNGNLCLGYADSTPDHILVLEQDFSQLSLRVNSGGGDTTLLVQGPNDNTVRCGDDTRNSPDASVQDSNWSAGRYKVWVGAIDSGARHEYTLTIQ